MVENNNDPAMQGQDEQPAEQKPSESDLLLKVEVTEKVKKSVIQKTIRRTFNVAPFENLDVSVSFQEEIEWANMGERRKKSEAVTRALLLDFQQTARTTFQGMGLAYKGMEPTTVNLPPEDTNQPETTAPTETTKEEVKTPETVSLDEMDGLGK